MSHPDRKPTTAADEAEIRSLMDAWAKCLETRDLDSLTVAYDPDVLLYDVKPPFQIRGADAYRKMWEDCLPYFPKRFTFERRQLEISVGGDAAFAHFVTCVRPIGEESLGPAMWLRATICYRRSAGRWWVAHEHVSTPFDPMTGKAVFASDAELASAGA